MEKFLRNEDVNFVKLKLANHHGRFLRRFLLSQSSLHRFIEIWNKVDRKERSKFVGNSCYSLKSRIHHEVVQFSTLEGIITKHFRKTSDSTFLNGSYNSRKDQNIGILSDLRQLRELNNPYLQTVKDQAASLLRLVDQNFLKPVDFLAAFSSDLCIQYAGCQLLDGEKFILPSELYDSFIKEFFDLFDQKVIDTHPQMSFSPVHTLSKCLAAHLLLLVDKITENMLVQQQAGLLSLTPDLDTVYPNQSTITQEWPDEFISISVSPEKSKDQSVVRPTPDDHRYFRIRSCTRPLNSLAFVRNEDDLALLGAFYSVNISSVKDIHDSAGIIFANFVAVNRPSSDVTFNEILTRFRSGLSLNKSTLQNKPPNAYNNGPSYQPHHRQHKGHSNNIHHYASNQLYNNQSTQRLSQSGKKQTAVHHTNDKRKYSAFNKPYKDEQPPRRDRFVSESGTTLEPVRLFDNQNYNHKLTRAGTKPESETIAIPSSPESKKKVLRATSSCFHNPESGELLLVKDQTGDQYQQKTTDHTETNISLHFDDLDFSQMDKQGSGWREIEENKIAGFEKFDVSESNSLLNLIALPSRLQAKNYIESKQSLDSSAVSKESGHAALHSPRTDTSASHNLSGGLFILNENLLDKPRVHQSMNSSEMLLAENQSLGDYITPMETSVTGQKGLYTIREVEDKYKMEDRNKTENKSSEVMFPRLQDTLTAINDLTAAEQNKLWEEQNAQRRPPAPPPQPPSHQGRSERRRKGKPASHTTYTKKNPKF